MNVSAKAVVLEVLSAGESIDKQTPLEMGVTVDPEGLDREERPE